MPNYWVEISVYHYDDDEPGVKLDFYKGMRKLSKDLPTRDKLSDAVRKILKEL